MINNPEASAVIKKSTEEYLKSDQEQLGKRPELEAQQTAIKKEQESIKQFEKTLPYAARNLLIEVTGETNAPQNILAQTDKSAAQTAAVIQEQQQQQRVSVGTVLL